MKSFTLVFTVLGLSLSAVAHDGHVHEPAVEAPPHGGLLRDAPPFKGEVVVEGELAKFYLYDLKLNPLRPEKATLKGDFQLPREKKGKPVTFTKSGDHYQVKLPGIAKVHRFDLHVYIEHGGKKALGDFGVDNIQ